MSLVSFKVGGDKMLGGVLLPALQGLVFISYIIVRILPAPILIYSLLQFLTGYVKYWEQFSMLNYFMTAAFAWIPFALNFFWFYLISKKAKK